MNITKNQIDDLNATITIELCKEDYEDGVEKALKDYQKKAVVKGFRQGKTPMGIIRKMYEKNVLIDELNKVLGDALNGYIKDNDLHVFGDPLPNETEETMYDFENGNFEFMYDIAFIPDANIKMSKREKMPYYIIKVDDEMVDKQIEGICKNHGNMVPVDVIEGDEYLTGELIELDENGEAKEGGIKNDDASMSLHYMKDEEALNAFKGKKVGEEVKFNAVKSYPNKIDFASMLGVDKKVAEKSGENYCFIIREIKRFISAKVDDVLFTRLYGDGIVKDAEDFRARVKNDIKEQLKNHSDYRFALDVKEKFLKKNEDLALPEEFLKRWIVSVSDDMTLEDAGHDFDKYREELKWQLVKAAIMKEYDVTIETEDMQVEARHIAAAQLQQYGLYGLTDAQLDGFATKLLNDDKQRQQLYERAMETKVFDIVRENMKLEEQEVSLADFENLFKQSLAV